MAARKEGMGEHKALPRANTLGDDALSTHPSVSGADASPELPIEFGRYRLLKQLGVGGMATVFLADDTILNRKVALKLPHIANTNRNHLDRFRREAQLSASLEHPNICQVYDIGEHEGRPYLTMAYIEGDTLDKIIRTRGAVASGIAASLVRGIANTVHFAHLQGIIHRDLKPANIMIMKSQKFVIMDFGLARRFEKEDRQLTVTGAVLGTPAYMAPEQLRGESDKIGPQSDVYSLGIILYELLVGERPFQGTLPQIYAEVLTAHSIAPSIERGIDPALCAICRKATTSDIEQRYRSASELAAGLSDYLSQNLDGLKEAPPANHTAANSAVVDHPVRLRSEELPNAGKRGLQRFQLERRKRRLRNTLAVLGLGLMTVVVSLSIAVGMLRKRGESNPSFAGIMDRLYPRMAIPNASTADSEAVDSSLPTDLSSTQSDSTPSLPSLPNSDASDAGDNKFGDSQLADSKSSSDVFSATVLEAAESLGIIASTAEPPSSKTRAETRDDNSLKMKLAWIPPGSFRMGSPATELRRDADETQVEVRLTHGFWLGQTEVTQSQWCQLMSNKPWEDEGSLPSGDNFPAANLSLSDCVAFLNRLNLREEKTIPNGYVYALPSEAQWEYACRAGTVTRFCCGDTAGQLHRFAVFGGASHMQEVGSKQANPFGLYDMHGNVSEWCRDIYVGNLPGGMDPSVEKGIAYRVIKGGNWAQDESRCRSAERSEGTNSRNSTVGFRVAMVPIASTQSTASKAIEKPNSLSAFSQPKPASPPSPATIVIDAASKPKLTSLITPAQLLRVGGDTFDKRQPNKKSNQPLIENGAMSVKSDGGVLANNFASLAESQLFYARVRIRHAKGSVALNLATHAGPGIATWIDGEGGVKIGPSIFAGEQAKQSMQIRTYSIGNVVKPRDAWNDVAYLRSRGSLSVFINNVLVDTFDLKAEFNASSTLAFGLSSQYAGTRAEMDAFEIYQVR